MLLIICAIPVCFWVARCGGGADLLISCLSTIGQGAHRVAAARGGRLPAGGQLRPGARQCVERAHHHGCCRSFNLRTSRPSASSRTSASPRRAPSPLLSSMQRYQATLPEHSMRFDTALISNTIACVRKHAHAKAALTMAPVPTADARPAPCCGHPSRAAAFPRPRPRGPRRAAARSAAAAAAQHPPPAAAAAWEAPT